MQDNPILYERERRSIKAQEYAASSDVAVIKVNVPGIDKNIPEAQIIMSIFLAKADANSFSVRELSFGADGTCAFCTVAGAKEIKEQAVKIEEEHPLGRFIDIDVIPKAASRSLSRANMRKCFICDRPAFVTAASFYSKLQSKG